MVRIMTKYLHKEIFLFIRIIFYFRILNTVIYSIKIYLHELVYNYWLTSTLKGLYV